MPDLPQIEFYEINIRKEEITFQYRVAETGAKVAIQFTMDQADLDAVQTMLDRFETRISYMLTGNSWEPSIGKNSFIPDR